MRLPFKRPGFFGLARLPALALMALAVAPLHGQAVAAVPPTLAWKDLLNCELIVVGHYKNHNGNTLSLQVDEVLRGTTCKAGAVLAVKLSQTLLVEFPGLFHVEEFQGNLVNKKVVVPDLKKTYVYFFPKEKPVLDRSSQVRPDWHNGWKQALAGQPINLSFRLLYEVDRETSQQAVAELFKTRPRQVIDDLIEASRMPHGIWIHHWPTPLSLQFYARRTLRGLGDEKGDVYDAAWKALTSKAHQDPGHLDFLTRLLAQIDSKRALGDLKKLLSFSPPNLSRESVIWAMASLETEEGLDLLFDQLAQGEPSAANCLQDLMSFSTAQPTSMVKLAKLQDLAAPRLQKMIKAGKLSPDKALSELADLPPDSILWRTESWRFRPRDYPDYNRLRPRPSLPDWDAIVGSAWGNLEPLLTNDLVEGRKRLLARLTAAPTPELLEELPALYRLVQLYGDSYLLRKFKKSNKDPFVLFRDGTRFFIWHCEPLSVFLKKMDTLERIRTDGSQTMSFDWGFRLNALFEDHPEEIFRRLLGLVTSGNQAEFQYAMLQLESQFHWNFDLAFWDNYVVSTRHHMIDLPPVLERKIEKIRPLLAALTRAGSMLEKRGVLLRHFGVPLPGPPGKAWLPAIEKAALSWNYTISVNALYVLGDLLEDADVLQFNVVPVPFRKHAMDLHFKQQRESKKEETPLSEARLKELWQDLASNDRATGYAAMRSMVAAPKSTLAWLRKNLKEPAVDQKVLTPLGEAVEQAGDPETRRRITDVLDWHKCNNPTYYRMVRAVQVLEYLTGPEARGFLEQLAGGADRLALTHESKAALGRIRKW